ncbi:MAG: hypothetical protein ACRD3A_05975 [Terriglobales bacterium]
MRAVFDLLGLLSVVLYFVALVCWVIILIHAFKNGGALRGILCLCVPFYIIYYMFAKFEHERKYLIIGGYFGGFIIGRLLQCRGLLLLGERTCG